MKKYFNLFLSAIVFVSAMLLCWYGRVLLDRYFVFAIIPLWFLVFSAGAICFIVALLGILRFPKRLSNYVPLFVLVMTVIVSFVFPFTMAKVKLELVLFSDERVEVVEMVKNGEIVADELGNASLPSGYSKTSSDRNIFVYQNDEEQVIGFWEFRGLLSGSQIIMYSSQGEELIYKNETVHPITSVIKLKDHWYYVETDY